jgi:hypothetical protein
MHAVLYRSSVGIAGLNVSLTGVPFSFDTLTNNKILMPWDGDLLAATVYALNLTSARIVTPLIQATALVHLTPFGTAATAGSNPNTCDMQDFPVALRQTESIDIQTSNGDAAAQIAVAILQLGDRRYSKPAGPSFNIRATGATALAAGAWTRVPLTFDDNLPNKLYSIIGFQALSATGVLSRIVTPASSMAPGFPTITSLANRMFWSQYDTSFGELARFTNQALPVLEQFSTAADATQQVWLRIKVIG